MEFHPISKIYPLIEGSEFIALKADIEKNGLLEAIWLHPDGRILDGRNRWRACQELDGTEATFRTYEGDQSIQSLVSFIRSLNEKRRHLDSSQLACVAVECEELVRQFEEEARERQGTRTDLQDNITQQIEYSENSNRNDNLSEQSLARSFNTNREYIHQAKVLKEKAPQLFEEAKAGTRNLRNAWREYKQSQDKQQADLPSGTYRVIYADPPWKYGNNMPEYFHEQADHYPLMTIKEVAAMPIEEIAQDNAVLFLWVTSPILDECFEVVKAWGFEYKASFIWDKVKHNLGHYNSVRHEILLICTRGSCMPDVQKLFDSVQVIERKEHSSKPEEFRQIIATIYPNGKRIELFARKKIEIQAVIKINMSTFHKTNFYILA